MELMSGLLLVAVGAGLVLVALPRPGEDIRPFLKSPLAQAVYPSVCLVFFAMGAAVVVTSLL